MPMMSPAYASSAVSRCCAKKRIGDATVISLPSRTCNSFMPRRNLPRAQPHEGDAVAVVGVHVGLDLEDEARRPDLRPASTVRCVALRGNGHGAHFRAPSSNCSTPKLRSALPKKTGRQVPFAERLKVEFRQRAACASSTPSSAGAAMRASMPAISSSATSVKILKRLDAAERSRARSPSGKQQSWPPGMSSTPRKSVPMPIGQRHRHEIERQPGGDLIEQRQRVLALAVDLVDEGDDRDVAHAGKLRTACASGSRCPWPRRSP